LQLGKRSLIRFREKGGKEKEIPVHHKLEEYLDVYLEAAKLSEQPASPLFRSTRGRSRELGTDGLSRKDAWAMLKRRLRDAGLSTIYSNHSFRAALVDSSIQRSTKFSDVFAISLVLKAKRNAAGNGIKPTSDLSLRSGESLARYH